MLPSVLLTAAILLLPALLYAWGRHADSFAVERVTVAGGHRVSEKQALRTLRREFLGDNLFTITTGDVRAALDEYCYLAAVEVDRDFPTDLRVRLVEHRPSMYVLAKGRWFVVADTGHVICEVGERARAASPPASGGAPTTVPSPTSSDHALSRAVREPVVGCVGRDAGGGRGGRRRGGRAGSCRAGGRGAGGRGASRGTRRGPSRR